jgi:hypothetical protein
VILLFHLAAPSQFNANQWPWQTDWAAKVQAVQEHVDLHQNTPVFSKRPAVNFLIQSATQIGLSVWWSFLILQLLALVGVGWMVVQVVGASESLTSPRAVLLFFYLQFSILFAFFASNYTYDDVVQYFFLLSVMASIQRKNYLLSGVLFFMAMLTRESSVLMLPGFWFIIEEPTREKLKAMLWLLLGAVCYFLLSRWFGFQDVDRSGFLFYNFQSVDFAVESVISLCLVLGPSLLLSLRLGSTSRERNYRLAFWTVAALNTVVVLVSTKAREARLFAMPVLWLLPVLGDALSGVFAKGHFTQGLKNALRGHFLLWAFCVCSCIIIARFSYHPTSAGWSTGFRIYLIIVFTFMITERLGSKSKG